MGECNIYSCMGSATGDFMDKRKLPGNILPQENKAEFFRSSEATGTNDISKDFRLSVCSSNTIFERKRRKVSSKIVILSAIFAALLVLATCSIALSLKAISKAGQANTDVKYVRDDAALNQTNARLEEKIEILQKLHDNTASDVVEVNISLAENEKKMEGFVSELRYTVDGLSRTAAESVAKLQKKIEDLQRSQQILDRRTSIRLGGGEEPGEGRVEIFHAGLWGTICDHKWNVQAANVTCKMLGFSKAASYFTGSWFGRGIGKIWLDLVECTGLESDLSECEHGGWGWAAYQCDQHRWDAGVRCA